MASEAVKKILDAESESERKNALARKRRDEIISEAEGKASQLIQKRLGDAAAESRKIKAEYDKKLVAYREKAGADCDSELADIREKAEKNMQKAVDAVINEYF